MGLPATVCRLNSGDTLGWIVLYFCSRRGEVTLWRILVISNNAEACIPSWTIPISRAASEKILLKSPAYSALARSPGRPKVPQVDDSVDRRPVRETVAGRDRMRRTALKAAVSPGSHSWHSSDHSGPSPRQTSARARPPTATDPVPDHRWNRSPRQLTATDQRGRPPRHTDAPDHCTRPSHQTTAQTRSQQTTAPDRHSRPQHRDGRSSGVLWAAPFEPLRPAYLALSVPGVGAGGDSQSEDRYSAGPSSRRGQPRRETLAHFRSGNGEGLRLQGRWKFQFPAGPEILSMWKASLIAAN